MSQNMELTRLNTTINKKLHVKQYLKSIRKHSRVVNMIGFEYFLPYILINYTTCFLILSYMKLLQSSKVFEIKVNMLKFFCIINIYIYNCLNTCQIIINYKTIIYFFKKITKYIECKQRQIGNQKKNYRFSTEIFTFKGQKHFFKIKIKIFLKIYHISF